MGSASSSSTSVSTMMVKDNLNMFSNVANTASSAIAQTISIDIENVAGNVDFSNNSLSQEATVNLSSAFDATSSNDAQRALAASVQQSAKSLQSGIPTSIVSSSNSSTISNTYIESSANISSSISNTCFASANQTQTIKVKNVGGNVSLTDNSFSQIAEALATCFGNVANNNTSVSNIQATTDQLSSAENKGFSFDFLSIFGSATTIMAIVGGIVVVLIVVKVLKSSSNRSFNKEHSSIFSSVSSSSSTNIPTLIKTSYGILGFLTLLFVLLSIIAISKTQTDMIQTSFANSIAKDCPDAVVLSQDNNATSAIEAMQNCIANSDCKGVDFIGYTIANDNESLASILTQPLTTYYSSVPKNCSLTQDTLNIIYMPSYAQGPGGPPIPINNAQGLVQTPNIWLNTQTSDWYIYDQVTYQWIQKGKFSSAFNQPSLTASWANGLSPSTNLTAQLIVSVKIPANPATFNLSFNGKIIEVEGPGFFKFIPPQTNTSGIKITTIKTQWIITSVSGILLCLIAFGAVSFSLKK